MSLTRKIAYNTIVQFSSKIGSVGLGVITIGIMARYLGQTGFGQYSTIIAFLQFFGILVDFGLQLSMVNLLSNQKYNEEKIFNNTLTLRIISGVLFFVLAPIVVLLFPYEATIKIGVLVVTLNFFALAINQLLIGLFQKHLKMDKVAISEIFGKILLLTGVLLAIQLGYGLIGILGAIVISTLIQVSLLYLFAQKIIVFKWSFEKEIWQKIIHDSWPIAISIAFNLIYFKADTLVLSLTRSQAEVGIYSAPYRVLEILTQFPYLFVGLLFPILANAWTNHDIDKYKKYFQKTFDVLVIIAIPLVIGTIPLAHRLMILVAGPDFAASGNVLQIIIFATAIIFINVVFGYSIVILGKQKQLIWGYVATAGIALTLYIVYIPIYSYTAAAIITVFAELLITTINIIVSVRSSGFIPNLKIVLQSLFAAFVMYVIIKLSYSFNLAFIIIGATIGYFITLYVIGGIKKNTLLDVLKIKS